jgi:hypothetical protein
MNTKAALFGYRRALMARFIQSDVAGAVILAGKRAGQTAACAGISRLL